MPDADEAHGTFADFRDEVNEDQDYQRDVHSGRLFVTRSDSTEPLHLLEGSFDEVPRLVLFLVVFTLNEPVASGWHYYFGLSFVAVVYEFVAVACLAGYEKVGFDAFDQLGRVWGFIVVAWDNEQVENVTVLIAGRDNFGGASNPALSDGLSLGAAVIFRAPVPS